MRDAIRRALASPPPRGAVVLVALGLAISVAALLLSRDPGTVGDDVPFEREEAVAEPPPAQLGDGGEVRIVDGLVSTTAANDFDDRLYKIEASAAVRAGARSRIELVRCQLRFPDRVYIGQSDGRRAAFPRPLADTADDAIKEGAPVEFETDDAAQAGLELRNAFFKYVVGGNPSVTWSNLAEGQHTWLWPYSEPVRATRTNFAIVLVSEGDRELPLECSAEASGPAGPQRAATRASVRLR